MDAQSPGRLFDAARRMFPLLARVESRGFLVGGAVRDLILGRTPRDADIAMVGAAAEASRFARSCGGRVAVLGAAPFDVVRVAVDGVVYDFAEIVGVSIDEDLSRRDFTVGAIALPLDEARGVIDPFGGVGDLGHATLRMVRESNFADDPLRVLRGARLVGELGMTVDGATLDAMRRHAAEVGRAAPERLGTEWLALLGTGDADGFRLGLELVRELALDRLVSGIALSDAAIRAATSEGDADPIRRLAAIALEGDEATLCGRSLQLGLGAARVDAVRRACWLVRALRAGAESPIDRVVLYDGGPEASRRAIGILRAAGSHELAERVAQLLGSDGERIFDARLLLDGNAIVAMTGLAPGPQVGAIRRALLEAQLRGEVESEEEARAFVERAGRGRGGC